MSNQSKRIIPPAARPITPPRDPQRGIDPANVHPTPPTPSQPGYQSSAVDRRLALDFIQDRAREKRTRQDMMLPYLLVRSMLGDSGSRPLPSPPVFQPASPDIIVVRGNVSTYDGVSATTQIQFDTPHTIFVHVWNLGRFAAIGVNISVFWTRSSGYPTPGNDPPPPFTNLIAAMYHDLPQRSDPHCHQLFRLPVLWTPRHSDAPIKGLAVKVSCMADLATPDFILRQDRHVALLDVHM